MDNRRLHEVVRPSGGRWSGAGHASRSLFLVLVLLLLAVWVLNVSRVGGAVEGCPHGCASAVRTPEGGLRVLSLNMLHGFPRFEHLDERLSVIEAEIRRADPDIVCLQEVPWRPGLGTAADYLAERLGLNHVYVRANGNRWAILFEEGEAILSRYPLRDAAFVELTPRAGFFEHRVALRAVAQSPWGDVAIVVTHLTNGDPYVNVGQTNSLKAFVEQAQAIGPAIIAGDFNATETSRQIGEVQWLDTYRAANPDDQGFTCCVDDLRAGPEQTLDQRIDYLFFAPVPGQAGSVIDSRRAFAEPQRAGGMWLWPSDHVGLLSVLSLDGSTDPRRGTR